MFIRIVGMTEQPQKSKGDAFASALSLSPYTPADLGRSLGFDSSNAGQKINNWKKRGVPAKYATFVADMLNCSSAEISSVANPRSSSMSASLILKKKQISDDVNELLSRVDDEKQLEAIRNHLLSAAQLMNL